MTDKERYATIGTWEKVLREEGVKVSDDTIRRRLRETTIIGETARNKMGNVVQEGFYAECDVRQACHELMNSLGAEYFSDSSNVLHDLTAFASQLGEDMTPFDLTTGNFESLQITCQNGKVMKGATYLKTAAVALGFAQNKLEARSKSTQILKYLLGTADFEIFDRDYFQNLDNLRADLTAFASQLGESKTPLDLSTGNIPSLSITCQNGRVMMGERYLHTAAVALGLTKTRREACSKRALTLRTLKEIAGFKS